MRMHPDWIEYRYRVRQATLYVDTVGMRYENGHQYAITRSGKLVPLPDKPAVSVWIEEESSDEDR